MKHKGFLYYWDDEKNKVVEYDTMNHKTRFLDKLEGDLDTKFYWHVKEYYDLGMVYDDDDFVADEYTSEEEDYETPMDKEYDSSYEVYKSGKVHSLIPKHLRKQSRREAPKKDFVAKNKAHKPKNPSKSTSKAKPVQGKPPKAQPKKSVKFEDTRESASPDNPSFSPTSLMNYTVKIVCDDAMANSLVVSTKEGPFLVYLNHYSTKVFNRDVLQVIETAEIKGFDRDGKPFSAKLKDLHNQHAKCKVKTCASDNIWLIPILKSAYKPPIANWANPNKSRIFWIDQYGNQPVRS
jgi:hypothetical protein